MAKPKNAEHPAGLGVSVSVPTKDRAKKKLELDRKIRDKKRAKK